MDDSSQRRTGACAGSGYLTRGAPQAVGSAVIRSIGPVRTICPRWTPSTVRGVRRRVSDDRAAPSTRQVLGHAICLAAASTSMLHHSPLDTSSTTGRLTRHRCLTRHPATVASRHLATAASPHRPPPPHQAQRRGTISANEASKRCLAANRMILGRRLYAGLRSVEPDFKASRRV